MFFFKYVLRCADGKYIGSTTDLRRRLSQHKAAEVAATALRLLGWEILHRFYD
jgi:predicted GIY-YIG superfamily endonuclease